MRCRNNAVGNYNFKCEKFNFYILIFFSVGFPILIFFLVGDPYKRGFFCDDESLKHPFHDSTVKSWMLYIIGLVLPIGMVSILTYYFKYLYLYTSKYN